MTAKAAVPMTRGPIWKRLLSFTLPLFLGNLFQQFYNTADSLIVGNFLGSNALAAVSSCGSLIFLLVGFMNGMSIGAGAVIARYYGAKDFPKVKRAIHTSVAFGLAASAVLTLVGTLLAPQVLSLMGTPAHVLPNSVLYFRTYFAGSVTLVMYNIFVGILQSVGDSRHPLYYLILSSMINVGLDLLFVGVFHWGVASAALATIISQLVSALLCFIQLLQAPESYRLSVKELRFDPMMLQQIVTIGLPSGLQNSIISIANVIVQANINAFGEMAMAGCGAYLKIEVFAALPVTCFAMALTTFIGQNLGAGEYVRARKGAVFGIVCATLLTQAAGVFVYCFAPALLAGFVSEPEAIAFGVSHAHTIAPFYFFMAFSNAVAGVLRGAGRSTVPMVITVGCWCVLRVIYITITTHFIWDIRVVFWAYPLTWAVSSVMLLVYLLRSNWSQGYEH